MSKTNKEPLTSLPKKWNKLIENMPEFKEAADAADVDGLKKIIIDCEGNLYTINKEKEADVKLAGAKEAVKEFSEPYRDASNHQQAKIQYALLCLESKGVDLDNKE